MLNALGAVMALVGVSDNVPPPSAVTADITSVYQKKYEHVMTLRIKCVITGHPIVAEEELFREFGLLPPFPRDLELVAHRDGRLYWSHVDPWTKIFSGVFERVAEADPHVRGDSDRLFKQPYDIVRQWAETELSRHPQLAPRVLIYDGRKLWEYEPGDTLTTGGVSRQAFVVMDHKRFTARYLPKTLLDSMLFSFDVPGLPSEREYRRKNRWPDLLSHKPFRVRDEPEREDGAPCILVEALGEERIYLDKQLGYAVRKRQWIRDAHVIYEFVARDFENVADGLWLPRAARYTQYGSKENANGRYLGRPVYREEFRVQQIELNRDEHLDYFAMDVPPGARVIDQTLPARDEYGNPISIPRTRPNVIPAVSYIQPADRDDLEDVVRQAQLAAGRANAPLDDQRRGRVLAVLIACNVGMLVVVASWLAYRRRKGRTTGAPQ